MTERNWADVFDEAYPESGLPAQYLADGVIEGYLFEPLTFTERSEIEARGAGTAGWVMPADRPLPSSYKAFLGWSNGGVFVTGDREFQMLKAQELREYLLLYDVPESMPLAVPFALDGAGGFYLFDLRDPPDERGEYPVLFVRAGSLRYPGSFLLGRSFEEALRDRRPPEDP